MIQKNGNTLKYVSLITLTLQNAVLGLSMRYARTRPGDLFFSSTAVFMSEIVKLFTCLILVFYEEGKTFKRFTEALHTTIIKNPVDTFKICVPSFLYVIQNNLLYISASNLDAATYQVTYQLKILTTAIFAVMILRKKLFSTQWGALILLIIGVILVQLAPSETATAVTKSVTGMGDTATGDTENSMPVQNRLFGFAAALGACLISGFAGIYFEKMLKGADISVWMRNVQLSLLSIPFSLMTCFVSGYTDILSKGFFFGYDLFVCYLVVLQAGGGLIVAVVVKYADNILKGFATSLAIIISCIASIFLFQFVLTIQFASGALIVIASIFLYGYDPTTKNQSAQDSKDKEKQEEEMIPKV